MKILRIPLVIALIVVVGQAFNAGAETETILYSFGLDGEYPEAGLVQGSDSNFYGTTAGFLDGGSDGTVFRISPSGTYTTLYSFAGYPNDGANPFFAGLVQGSDSNFYGTTGYGGVNDDGTVFRISSNGSYTNLYSFGSNYPDGLEPKGLVQGSDGSFYGTTSYGGTGTNCPNGSTADGCGTVFRISPSGNETILYSFGSSPNDGASPWAGLVLRQSSIAG